MILTFAGAQCTGKTTLINAIKKLPEFKDYEFVLYTIRKLAKAKNLGINEHANNTTQMAITNAHIENLELGENIIIDRGLLDCMAYTKYMLAHDQVDNITFNEVNKKFTEYINKYDKIFYLAPEFAMVEDGVRSTNIAFRDEVVQCYDHYIKIINSRFPGKVVKLTGSVKERVSQLLEVLKNE